MHTVKFKILELFVLFVLIPISFTGNYAFWIKAIIALVGFIYILFVLLRIENKDVVLAKNISWRLFWIKVSIRLLLIMVSTILYVYFMDVDALFRAIRNNPLWFALIALMYSSFSVYPQELIFRTFFFSRYGKLLTGENQLVFVSAIFFSMAHLIFNSILVLLITFIGGLLFGSTYLRTKSTVLVTIEHAIYGCWLYTVGMGEMLGFPS